MSTKKVNSGSQRILAEYLSGRHIGRRARFMLVDETHETLRVVEGELRQIYHVGGEVHINIGLGAEEEYSLNPGACILLDPATPLDADPLDDIIWE